MILKEIFYINKETTNIEQDDSYNNDHNVDVLSIGDTRKTKLTLGQINQLRRASDFHNKEKQAELDFISRMYATPTEPTM